MAEYILTADGPKQVPDESAPADEREAFAAAVLAEFGPPPVDAAPAPAADKE